MIFVLIKLILLPLLAPLGVGLIRKVKAFMQNRQGASVIQPYFDIWKLFHKDEVVSKDASWIFMITPYIVFGVSVLMVGAVPLFGIGEMNMPFADFLVVLYVLALGTFFLALAGIDTGSAFGGFGSSREMTLASLTEVVLLFSILPIGLLAHSSNLPNMAVLVMQLPITTYISFYITLVSAFAGFVIVFFSETGRIPFDNPATHLELTMIHEAMILEYSGKRLALIEWAHANKLFFFVLLGVNIFFPWGLALHTDLLSIIFSFFISMFKVGGFLILVAILESSFAKFRYFRLPDILLTGFILALIALITIVI